MIETLIQVKSNRRTDCFDIGTGFNYFTGSGTTLFALFELKINPSDGSLFVGGAFNNYNSTPLTQIGVATSAGIVKIKPDGSIDQSFTNYGFTTGGLGIQTIQINNDGTIYVGGGFTAYSGNTRGNIVKLNADGTLNTGFNPSTGFNNRVIDIEVQSDNKLICVGAFSSFSGTSKNYIARLNTNGTLDTSFTGSTNNFIYDAAIQSDGKIICVGDFTTQNGTSRNRICRFNTDGSIDAGFSIGTGLNFRAYVVELQSDGKILVGGQFSTYSGVSVNRVVRLNTNGTIDSSFTAASIGNFTVLDLAIQSTGKILVQSTGGFYRLNTNGTLDTTFVQSIADATTSAFIGAAEAIVVNNDDSFYATNVSSYNGQPVGGIVKCLPDGSQLNCPQGQNIYLDLYDDVSINLNMSFAEIQDITSKNSGYSESFRVPGTPKNSRFFNYMFDVNADNLSFNIQESVSCSVSYKGNTVLDGSLRLLRIYVNDNRVDYEVNIQDEVGELINDISNKLLIDLDYTDLEHAYTATNVLTSWTATYTGLTTTGGLKNGAILYGFHHNGYIYGTGGTPTVSGATYNTPLLELYGTPGSFSFSGTPMTTIGFKPSIQIKDLVNRIFKQNNYILESNFFDSEYFQRLYMPLMSNSDQYLLNPTFQSQITLSGDTTPTQFTGTTISAGLTGYTGTCQFNQIIFNNGTDYPPYGWNILNGKYYAQSGGTYTFNYYIELDILNAIGNIDSEGEVFLCVNRNLGTVYGSNIYDLYNYDPITPNPTQQINETNITITLSPGDYVELCVSYLDGTTGGQTFIIPNISTATNVEVTDTPMSVLGSTVYIDEELSPEHKQLDFLKGLMTQFNLVLVKHKYKTDTYIMEPYELYVGEGEMWDWTGKLDKSKDIVISPITNIMGKAINFEYQDDADAKNVFTKSLNNNRIFGTENFIPNTKLNDQPLNIKSFFAATPCDILPGSSTDAQPFIVPHFYSLKEQTNNGVTSQQLLPMKIKPRILHYGGLQSVPSGNTWYFYNEVTSGTTAYTTYPLLHHQEEVSIFNTGDVRDLNFGSLASPQDEYVRTNTTNTAYELYYSDYIEDLLNPDARMVTAYFDLTVEDIVNTEYKDIIFVKDAHYRINKINNFNLINNATTQVELVKLLRIDFDYIPPTPTPTPTSTPTPTPTNTPTPTPTNTPTPTPTNTNTPTPTPTNTNTPTPTPTPTNTPTPTPVPIPCVCVEITVTGTTAPQEGFAGSISYNNCNGVLVNENFATPGIRYRCIDYTGNIIQIFSSTNIVYGIAAGVSCSNGTCPTGETITCICYSYVNETEGSLTIDYVACDGTQPIIGVPGGASGNFCARIGQYTGDTGLFITTCTPTIYCQGGFSICDNCGATPTPTPTNTPTPTPTNTPTPTPTTDPYDYYLADEYGCDDSCNLQFSGVAVAFPTGTSVTIGKFYRRFDDQPFVYQITDVTTPQIAVILKTPQYNTCSQACLYTPTPTPTPTNTNTPTPTPTNTNTPTPTPTFPPCVTSVTFDVDSAGDVRYVDCCGNTIYISYGIGPQVINDCIQYGSVFAVGATISNISYNNTACVCPPTPTPTNTNTPTPTPTNTPEPPTCECITIYNEGGTTGNYTITNCNGTTQSPNLIPGAKRTHCILAGSLVVINSGLLTEVYCGTPCNITADCGVGC